MKKYYWFLAIHFTALLLACAHVDAAVDVDVIDRKGKTYIVIETDTKVCYTEVTEEFKKLEQDKMVKKAMEAYRGNECILKSP